MRVFVWKGRQYQNEYALTCALRPASAALRKLTLTVSVPAGVDASAE